MHTIDRTIDAKIALVKLLQAAYSGELAAALAYKGHATAVKDDTERAEILKICEDELHHRDRLGDMVQRLGGNIDPKLERKMTVIGNIIGSLCSWTGWIPGSWFIAMYGAGRLESHNIKEYEDAARLALISGYDYFVSELLLFGEVEWDHEKYFRKKVKTHFLSNLIPLWPETQSRENIQSSFEDFATSTKVTVDE